MNITLIEVGCMLRIRLITAAILAALLIYSVGFTDSPLGPMLLFVGAVLLTGTEFIALRWHTIDGIAHTEFPRPPIRREHFGMGAAYAMTMPVEVGGEYFFKSESGGMAAVFMWFAISTVVSSALFYKREIDLDLATQKLMNFLAGFVYIALPGFLMFKLSRVDIPGSPQGIALFMSLAIILMGDSGAYFAGRAFGKTLLLPKVSPKKTKEGAIGGLFASVLTGMGIVWFFNLPLHLGKVAVLALLGGLSGQIGDLAESALKRAANCKDSGNLLPGHGGMLDRVDALLFGVPILYLMFVTLV
jgi:phosphatidate cytidylyltransferase